MTALDNLEGEPLWFRLQDDGRSAVRESDLLALRNVLANPEGRKPSRSRNAIAARRPHRGARQLEMTGAAAPRNEGLKA
jgi:hypothetical protein